MKQLKQAQKKFWGFNRISTHDLHDTGEMLYQLSYMYDALLVLGQEWIYQHPTQTAVPWI